MERHTEQHGEVVATERERNLQAVGMQRPVNVRHQGENHGEGRLTQNDGDVQMQPCTGLTRRC